MICIKAEKRHQCGSIATKKYRAEGFIPANLYGRGKKNIHLLVNPKDIIKIKAKRNCLIISLDIDNDKHQVLLQDIQYHPVTIKPLHVDFFAIGDNTKVKVNIPIRYLNTDKCVGLKLGGYLNKIYRRFSIICPPTDIPESIDLDTTNFDLGKIVKVSDINLSEKSIPLLAKNVVLCNIIGRAAQEKTEENTSSTSTNDNKK